MSDRNNLQFYCDMFKEWLTALEKPGMIGDLSIVDAFPQAYFDERWHLRGTMPVKIYNAGAWEALCNPDLLHLANYHTIASHSGSTVGVSAYITCTFDFDSGALGRPTKKDLKIQIFWVSNAKFLIYKEAWDTVKPYIEMLPLQIKSDILSHTLKLRDEAVTELQKRAKSIQSDLARQERLLSEYM